MFTVVLACFFTIPDGSAGIERGRVYANVGGGTISDHSRCYVLIRRFFSGLLHSWDLHKKEETMVFEAHVQNSDARVVFIFYFYEMIWPALHHCIYFYNPPRTRDH